MDVAKDEDMVDLIRFFDALDAAKACESLDAKEIPFIIEDFCKRKQGIDKFSEEPAIQLEIRVFPEDLERAKVCLREAMHLFPLPEITAGYESDSSDDDEVLSEAIICDEFSDAEAAKLALGDAGIWSSVRRAVDDEDGTVFYPVEVKGKDIERAVRVVDQWVESRN